MPVIGIGTGKIDDVRYKITVHREDNELNNYSLIIRDKKRKIDQSLFVIANGDKVQFIKARINDQAIKSCFEFGDPFKTASCSTSYVKGGVVYRDPDGTKVFRIVESNLSTRATTAFDGYSSLPNDIECPGVGQTDGYKCLSDDNVSDDLLCGLKHPRLREVLERADFISCTGFPGLRRFIQSRFDSYNEIMKGEYEPKEFIEEGVGNAPLIPRGSQLPSDEYIKQKIWAPKR